jgi:hypothetical protein
MKIDLSVEGAWSGYLLKWNQPVPSHPQFVFTPQIRYEADMLVNTDVTERDTGVSAGQIWMTKKDDIGLYVLMRKTASTPFEDRLEWSYIAGDVVIDHELNRNNGQIEPRIIRYKIVSVHYRLEVNSGGSHVVVEQSRVKRPKRSRADQPEN